MSDLAPGELPGTKTARGPAQGHSYHSYCPDCRRVQYSLYRHGPMTPAQHNKTFCVCQGKQTGMIEQRVTVYDLEDVMTPTEAEKERKRQNAK